jgi:hypothetical protein
LEGENLEILDNIEQVDDEKRSQRVFIENFGSHYIDAVQVGCRLAILGSMRSTDQTELSSFSASFKAAFGAAALKANVSSERSEVLSR